MARLTDTQLVILSAAAQREGGTVLPLPKSLRIWGAAVTRTLEDLCKKGLLATQPVTPDTETWREDDDGRPVMLVITETGLQAIDRGPDGDTDRQPAARRPRATKTKEHNGKKGPARTAKRESPPNSARPGTKLALLIDLLKRRRGATIDEIAEATGWQAHSVRGAISGALKKKLGLTVTSDILEKRGRVYRISGRS